MGKEAKKYDQMVCRNSKGMEPGGRSGPHGQGFVAGAVIALTLVLFALRVLTRLDEFIRHHAKIFDLYLEFETSRGAAQFMEEIRNQGMKLTEFELSKNKIKGEGPTAIATLEVRDKKKRRSCLILSVGWSA